MSGVADVVQQIRSRTPPSVRRAYRRLPVSWRQVVAARAEQPWQTRDRRDRDHLRLLLQLGVYRDDCCIDVGANQGGVLVDIVRAAPLGRHVAIEPIEALADVLRECFPDVDVLDVALADERGRLPFEVVEGVESLSSLVVGRQHEAFGSPPTRIIDVEVFPLDDVVPADRAYRFIKIDVEGAELAVLRGARRTIERDQPILVVEHGGTDPATSREFWNLIVGEFGYRLFDIDGNGPFDLDEFLDWAAPGEVWNWVAHP